ncbi:PhoH family protein [Thermogladius calderae 1633]|uniref:PhoH family protein n=1 Tax=Thermogladius calderae (strain DSM 22663 / VKM B-2946 / 1633) TaxID=1184251 RepID=I3TES0_THEC1|nr:PhoH family protein [Thermogladius calderae]AFK51258.1 PhoH family protein [Thermogladius calderae 1633]
MGELFKSLKPQTPGQEEMQIALSNKKYEIVGLFGPTGSGKSLFSLLYGVDAVLSGEYRRFVISRPVVDVTTGRELSMVELGEMYYDVASNYMGDVLSGYIEVEKIKELIKQGRIVIADTHYLRGRTFDDSIIFLDDVHSVSVESAVELITRIGRNSRLIVAGDPVFQREHGSKDSASLLREVLLGEESARVVDLGLKDIVRPGARRGVKLILETKLRTRKLKDSEKMIIDATKIRAPDAEVITAVEFIDEKKSVGLKTETLPDALIVVKEGYIGRLIGKGGERITAVESDTGLKLRAVELTLDLKPLVRSIHPIGWIHKHIIDADFAGPDLLVKVSSDAYPAFVGQKGSHVRFIDAVMRRLMGVGVRVIEVEAPKERRGEERKSGK